MLPRAAASLVAACLVVSCATFPDTPSSQADGRSPAAAGDVGIERVVLQAYRAIGDRHLYEPNFRNLSVEAYRGFASNDSTLMLEASETTLTVKRDGKEIVSRPAPSDPTDGRAWGSTLTELMAGSIDASPALQQVDRQMLIRQAMTATTKQLDRNRFQRDGGGGVGITVERTEDKKILIRAVQEGAPAAKAGIQIGDQILAIDSDSMIDRPLSDVVAKLRGAVGAPVTMTVLRPSQGAELTLPMKRGRIVPTTVVYERRGDVALIHLTGFNTATTDNLRAALDKAKADIGKDLVGIIIDMRSNRGGLLDQAQSVSEVFIADGMIFSTNGRHPDSKRTYRSSNGRPATGQLPIVVLMNGGSASAAEIVAAALQDRGRAVVIGTTSYGKGTVQTVVRLANEGELILTWSRLQAPSGYTWNELGVLPNICTSKVGGASKLGVASVDSNQNSLMRWHALRNPTPQEVTDLRKICPPGEATPEADVDLAVQLLRDRALYAHAVQSATFQAAARP
jgi:carboxyl-terminal processing protease